MQDQNETISRLAIMKSIWESGNVPVFDNGTTGTKEWLKDMFEYSMSLVHEGQAAQPTQTWPHPATTPPAPSGFGDKSKTVSPAQAKRFFAIAKSKGFSGPQMSSFLVQHGVHSGRSEDIPWKDYNKICADLEAARV